MNKQEQKSAITEHEQTVLNKLTEEVTNAGFEAAQLEAVVNDLENKLVEFAAFLAEADADKVTALANLDLAQEVLNHLEQLHRNSQTVALQTYQADTKIESAATNVAELIDKLIFSAQFIDKLKQTVNRKKTLIPPISNELVDVLNNASTNANTAVAAMLIALESCYAAEASGKEAKQISQLEFSQSVALVESFKGDSDGPVITVETDMPQATLPDRMNVLAGPTPLYLLLKDAYEQSLTKYSKALKAQQRVSRQLHEAQIRLAQAQNKLSSLEAGLNAATAAALTA